jgi:hypothetical protein
MLNIDQEQITLEGYPSEDDEEQIFLMAPLEPCSMVPVYDDYDYDPLESHEEEMEELNEQLVSCPEPEEE